ncbi:MAG: 5'/3'-nucleotidase SurE [Pseudanabaenaceae cyanobacterium SKYGB_i_bin29]|nr:5'/3'-nucleotidase SurE [Pseudanabaenaceae cyanobacterium SKYG29]MDW8421649.1 5'/3'-nucleotidase SurE [Pseudanabaenaceae cyanobacterium SKYGB_i_bin29]
MTSKNLLLISFCVLAGLCARAEALDIVLTNDDGVESALTQALASSLRAAGHRVIVSAPAQDQSGTGGGINFLRPITALTAPSRGGAIANGAPGIGILPGDPQSFYVNSSPVAASLYGIDIAAPRVFGKLPDLVISGPNYGNNTGLINNHSGTVNAALIAINRGIPAIAVSCEAPLNYRPVSQLQRGDIDFEIAEIVVLLVNTLEARRTVGGNALLPPGIGLNVNIPAFTAGRGKDLPIRFSRVGLASFVIPFFTENLSQDPVAQQFGANVAAPGVTLSLSPSLPRGLSVLPDVNPTSEQNVVRSGAVAISVIEGTHQAPEETRLQVIQKLDSLVR